MAVIYVDVDASGGNDGTSWDDAFTALQSAFAGGGSGDEIWVAEGTYKPSNEVGGAGDAYKTFQLENDLEVYGGFDGTESVKADRNWIANETILSGDLGATDAYHVFYHPTSLVGLTAILDGFTIIGGTAIGANAHGKGGGMHNNQAAPTVRNCIFESNHATITGGALYNFSSAAEFYNCQFLSNTSDEICGGVVCEESTETVFVCCEFADNTGPVAGGLYVGDNGEAILTNCTIADNIATSSGTDGAGGIYVESGSEVTLQNTIIRRNTADNGYDDIYNLGTTSLSYCCWSDDVTDVYQGSNFTVALSMTDDPAFTSATDRSLKSYSALIDNGNNSHIAITTDVINLYRLSGGTVDIGAYEYQFTVRLQYAAGDNGAVTGDADQTINYNSDGTAVTPVPDGGYSFEAWSDGSTANPRTDTGVTNDVDVEAIFTLDAVTSEELYESREVVDNTSARLLYSIKGSADQGEILAKARAVSPATFEGFDRSTITITPTHADTDNAAKSFWLADVAYKLTDIPRAQTGDSDYSFDTSGGSQHVTTALGTPATAGGVSDHGNAINFDPGTKRVNGVDIVAPKFSWTETHYLAANDVNDSYIRKVFQLTGQVNNASFKGFAAGEVLFLGATGSKRGDKDWEITFKFAASPNVDGFVVPGLAPVDKKGWQYLWVRYKMVDGTLGMQPVAEQVDVNEVYKDGNFSNLGIET